MSTALLTFSIGPVHTFIAQARRVADLWAGSSVLSHLIASGIRALRAKGGTMVFPALADGVDPPEGLPNRFVARVSAARAGDIAGHLESTVRNEWRRLAADTVRLLADEPYAMSVSPQIWRRDQDEDGCDQIDAALECAWSWVPEEGDSREAYAQASLAGAERFAASRLFRPFRQREELREKCAICGERTALPDGDRDRVRESWQRAEKAAKEKDERNQGFFRVDQTRLCLVCATKRFFPLITATEGERPARFQAFDAFEPPLNELAEDDPLKRRRIREKNRERLPYFALVAMDGDHLGRVLGWRAGEVKGGDLEGFHRAVSEVLSGFAECLRSPSSQDLNLGSLRGVTTRGRRPPQLIYAGGEDVLFVCDPRDALPAARAIREEYQRRFSQAVFPLVLRDAPEKAFTISAGILIAHTKHPAGLLFRGVLDLLDRKAKGEARRDAVALRLIKRGGVPVEVAFRWDDRTPCGDVSWVEAFDRLTERLRSPGLASRQSFNLRQEEETLFAVLGKDPERWRGWLAERLSRGVHSAAQAQELAAELVPFFVERRTAALRVARFLGREVPT